MSRFKTWCDEVDKANEAIDNVEAREMLLRHRVEGGMVVDVNRTEQMIRMTKAGVVIMITEYEATELINALLSMIEDEVGNEG
jgi:hypothetical protein